MKKVEKSGSKGAGATKEARTDRAPNVKAPPGMTTRRLGGGLRPVGFLVVPTDDNPAPCTFSGVLRGVGKKASTKPGMKDSEWGVFEAVEDQKSEVFDSETGEVFPVKAGMLVGVSKKGGLSGMKEELIGHWFGIEYTGKRIKLDGGRSPMWEILAEVSEDPYERG